MFELIQLRDYLCKCVYSMTQSDHLKKTMTLFVLNA